MTDLARQTLQKINKAHIAPKSRWHFLLRQGIIWGLLVISVLFGSFAFGIIIHQFSGTDWDIYTQLIGSFWEFIILVIPYLWLIFMFGFSLLTVHFFRYTKIGYKYSALLVISASVLLSIIGGIALYNTSIPQKSDDLFRRHIPLYEQINRLHERPLFNPEEGSLAGVITEVNLPMTVRLKNPRKDHRPQDWTVDIANVEIPPHIGIRVGTPAHFTGKVTSPNYFVADDIRTRMEPGKRFQKMPFHFQKKVKEKMNELRSTQ